MAKSEISISNQSKTASFSGWKNRAGAMGFVSCVLQVHYFKGLL